MDYSLTQGPMGVPGFQGTDGVPVSKPVFLDNKRSLYIKKIVLEEPPPLSACLCRVTPARRAAEDHQDWTVVTGPEENPERPASGQEDPDCLDSL